MSSPLISNVAKTEPFGSLVFGKVSNGSVFATFDINGDDIYTNGNPPDQHQMAANAMTNTGANQQVNNMAPYQVIRYCVATGGVYPSRN